MVRDSLEPCRAAVAAVSPDRDPYLALNSRANLAFAEGLTGRSRNADLDAISSRADAAGLRFVALKAILFSAVLAAEADERHTAVRLLERSLPGQLELGHINLIAQEICPRPELAVLIARRHRSNGLGPALLKALSGHWLFAQTAEHLKRECPSEVGTWLHHLATDRTAADHERVGRRRRVTKQAEHPGLQELTKRETEVLELLAEGISNGEIAASLYLSPSTVKTHVNRVFRKLGVTTRIQASLAYQRNQAVPPSPPHDRPPSPAPQDTTWV
jgi:DNA-binding CsgD family transcriptional regulator